MRADGYRFDRLRRTPGPPARPPRAPAPANRVMLTWDTAANNGIPFEWASLNAAQQAALTFGDCLAHAARGSVICAAIAPTRSTRAARPVSRTRHHPRRHRRLQPRLGGSALLALYVDVDRSPLHGGDHGGKQRSVVPAIHHGGANPAERGLCRARTTASCMDSRPEASMSTATSSRRGNDGRNAGLHAGIDAGERRACRPPPEAAPYDAIPRPWFRTSTASPRPSVRTPECVGCRCSIIRIRSTATTSSSTRPRARAICTMRGAWHTWLVGGLGAGGAAIYALDVTNPSASQKPMPRASSSANGAPPPSHARTWPTAATISAIPSGHR